MKNIVIIILTIFSTVSLGARNNTSVNASPSSIRTRSGDCAIGITKVNLEINNVRAMMLNSGDMWWDRSTAKYGVPALPQEDISAGKRQVSPLFAGSIWISGRISGNLVMAALKYSNDQYQYWPGPISVGQSTISSKVCNKFDKFWIVTSKEIDDFKNGKPATEAILKWPGKGNLNLLNDYTAMELGDGNLAPFYDADNSGTYNPENGLDYPVIKSTMDPEAASVADQMIFWVINDVGNSHKSPDASPIGVQVNCLAFAYRTADELNNMTFYTYEINNKSNSNLAETYMSQFVDADLGNFSDDYVGCDTVRSLGFVVNADDDDQTVTQAEGYGKNVPICAVDFFEGPRKTTGELIGLSSFIYFLNGSGGILNDPNSDIEVRNNQEGKTRNGQNFTQGANCTGGTIPTKYCFPGNPAKANEWSMCSVPLTGGDYRFVQNSGPFNMESGSRETISVGVIFVQPPAGSYNGCKIDIEQHLFPADEQAQRLFDFGFKNERGPDAPVLKIFESSNKLGFTLENPSVSNNYGELYNKPDISIPNYTSNVVKDTTYKFEGYIIYQVKSSTISSFADLQDPTKAVPIKIMDLNNNVVFPKRLIEKAGVYIALDSLPFNNSGLEKQFVITEDRFAQEGQRFLVNNKTYYFAAVAVAYNNYEDTVASGGNPYKIKRQKMQYKVSNNIEIYSASPHDENFYGVRTKADVGKAIDVTRKFGVGHGNYFLDILEATENLFKDPPYQLDELPYLGGRAPINVVVNDPYKIRNASFKLTLRDNLSTLPVKPIFNKDSTTWELEITDDGSTIPTAVIQSEDNIRRGTEQSIYATVQGKLVPYGISIALSTNEHIGDVRRNNNPIYPVIGAELKYKDSSKKWVTLLQNVPDADFTGWIKPGIKDEINAVTRANPKNVSNYNLVGKVKHFTDSLGKFANILKGSIAPYCLTNNRYVTSQTDNTLNYSSFGPGFKWRSLSNDVSKVKDSGEGPVNNLDSLFSVNIVITSNKEMWSKCVVLETGDNQVYNEYGAKKGQIRKSPSLEKDMVTPEPSGDIGRSWFPGYAINLETGERVNIYFGENSNKIGKNSANMIWDPGNIIQTALGTPIIGGGHYVYVTNTLYDEGAADQQILIDNFNKVTFSGGDSFLNTEVASIYRRFIWSFIPIADTTDPFYNNSNNYSVPKNDIRIKVRISKPYQWYLNDYESIYTFNTKGLAPESDVSTLTDSSFNEMRIVPNPYNAYSAYEQTSVQNLVKFIGVPKNSAISIFTTDGILVRKIKLGDVSTDNYLAANITKGDVNVDDAYSWDLRTTSGVLIASGVYYIHVNSPTKGEKVLKLFVTMRSPDVSNF